MKICVTGGAGFIGSHTVDRLVEEGHEVRVLDDYSTGRTAWTNPGARYLQVDVRDEAAADCIRMERPDALVHLAAHIDVRASVARPDFDASVNILGLLNLLQAGVESGLKRVIFASSGGTVYGERARLPAREDAPCEPVSPYAIAKLACEHYLRFYGQQHGMGWVALRYGNVYGPRQNASGEAGVVGIFARAMLEGRSPVVHGDGMQTRDYVYVDDVVEANLAALSSPHSGPINVGTGRELTVLDIFQTVSRATGHRQPPRHGPAQPGDLRRACLCPERVRHLLDWRPQVDLEQGIARTVEFFRG